MRLTKYLPASVVFYLTFVPGVSKVLAAPTNGDAGGSTFSLCPTESSGFNPLCALESDAGGLVRKFITIALIIAIIAALFFLIYGGIRWITSGGDEKQVESAKSHVVAAIVGLVIALAAWLILTFLGEFFGVNLLNFTLPSLTISG